MSFGIRTSFGDTSQQTFKSKVTNPSHTSFFKTKIPNATDTTTVELFRIPHGYNYTPGAMVYAADITSTSEESARYSPLTIGYIDLIPDSIPPLFLHAVQSFLRYRTDSKDLIIEYYQLKEGVNMPGATWAFRYMIFAESGS